MYQRLSEFELVEKTQAWEDNSKSETCDHSTQADESCDHSICGTASCDCSLNTISPCDPSPGGSGNGGNTIPSVDTIVDMLQTTALTSPETSLNWSVLPYGERAVVPYDPVPIYSVANSQEHQVGLVYHCQRHADSHKKLQG